MKKTLLFIDRYQYKLDYKFFNSISSDELKIHVVSYGTQTKFDNYLPDNLNDYSDIIVILNDVVLEDSFYTVKRSDRLAMGQSYSKKFFNVDNFKLYFKSLPSNTKYIYLDNNGENGIITKTEIQNWLTLNDVSTYVISSRLYNLVHNNASVGLSYLPILYMFTQQNFSQFPMLSYSAPSNPKYDFITYLGQYNKESNINARFEKLNSIFRNDLTGIKYEDDSNFKADETQFGAGKPGHYWNILNSLSAKIQIIFETYPHMGYTEFRDLDYSQFFFTEKIMKCFILPHPYLLIINKYWLNLLESFGFKFHKSSKGDTIKDFQNIIDNIKSNPDKWISDNNPYFEHNQRNLYEISKSIELPHHNILKKIISL